MSLRGSNGVRMRRIRASSGVRPPLRWLHGLHAATRFSHVWAAAAVARQHVVEGEVVGRSGRSTGRCGGRGRRSRAGSASRAAAGRRTWCWSRITDGARYAWRTVRIVAWSYSMTSALEPNTSRNARGMLQTLSGS